MFYQFVKHEVLTPLLSSKFKLFIFFLFVLFFNELHAQEVVAVSGGNAKSNNGSSMSYTVGQTFYSSNSSDEGIVEQGVQHAYSIAVENGINNSLYENITCKAYPNPTSDYLTLNIDKELNIPFFIVLCDINGRKLKQLNASEKLTDISMAEYREGVYLLNIFQGDELNSSLLKTFRIVKK